MSVVARRSCHRVRNPPRSTRGLGRNRSHLARWSRVCEVVEAKPGRVFAFRTVPERADLSRADSTTWRSELVAHADGIFVRHS
jgi:hypothetical protein